MTAMALKDGKRVATDGAGFKRHMTPIADIEPIARSIGGTNEMTVARGRRSAFANDLRVEEWGRPRRRRLG
jgi:hypothetical protein